MTQTPAQIEQEIVTELEARLSDFKGFIALLEAIPVSQGNNAVAVGLAKAIKTEMENVGKEVARITGHHLMSSFF